VQVKLGRYCEQGLGVPRDAEEATRLYRTAAERWEDVEAMMELARCFRDGVGVQPSAAMSAWWYQQAALAVRPRTSERSAAALSLSWSSGGVRRVVCVAGLMRRGTGRGPTWWETVTSAAMGWSMTWRRRRCGTVARRR
jgi:TPR repeat protein